MNSLLAWLDHRTGYKKFLHEALFENVPGGARWSYVWGSTLTFFSGKPSVLAICSRTPNGRCVPTYIVAP